MRRSLKHSPVGKRPASTFWFSAGTVIAVLAALGVVRWAVGGLASPPPSDLFSPYTRYVNVGECGAVTWQGVVWEDDQPYTEGGWGYIGSDYQARPPEYEPVADVSGEVYAEEGQYLHGCRAFGRDFGYRFDVPNGDYTIRLRFVEPVRGPGERPFDVLIEGQIALDDFDIVVAAGGLNIAIEQIFTATVSDGQLQIDFVGGQAGASDRKAIVQAIAVEGVAPTGLVESVTPTPEETILEEPPASAETATPTPETPPAEALPTEELPTEVPPTEIAPTPTPLPPTSETATATPDSPPASAEGYPQGVNAGACGPIPWNGIVWAADQPYSPGGWGHVGSDFHAVADGIAEPVLDEQGVFYGYEGQYLHRCQVYGQDFGYHFDVPNGAYEVRLRFAEPLYGPGERWFDVLAEGQLVLDNLDVAAAAGGTSRAMERAFVVNVADGKLEVHFLGGQGAPVDDNALLQAISISSNPTAATASRSPEQTATPTQVAQANTAAVAAQPVYAQYVNAGDCSSTGWAGVTWERDRAYSVGRWGHTGRSWTGRGPGLAMIRDENGVLYDDAGQYLHRCRAFGTRFAYRFDVPNGTYYVRLRFAEPLRGVGGRWFDVGIEGQLALDNFDIAAAAGGMGIAVERAFLVTVNDGQLQIDFVGAQGSADANAIVQAISVVSESVAPGTEPAPILPPPPTPTATNPPPTSAGPPTQSPTPMPTPTPVPGGRVYYVSTTGNDSNSGAQTAPFRTFAKALSVMRAGDTLLIFGGTYNTALSVSISGTASAPIRIAPVAGQRVVIDMQNTSAAPIRVTGSHIIVEGLEAMRTAGDGVQALGQYITIRGVTAHDTRGHGIYVDGQHIVVEDSTIYLSNLSNQGGTGGQWGSGLKVRVGGQDIILRRNTVYHNWGEGIAVTRGVNVVVEDNTVYDNWAVNLYVDNSRDVVVEGNFSYCTPGSEFGTPIGIALGEEVYSGWGAQLANVTIRNNIVGYCRNGVTFFGSDVGESALRSVVIAHNTIVGTTNTPIWLQNESAQGETLVANNILQRAEDGDGLYVETPDGVTISNNLEEGDPGFATTPGSTPDSYRLGAGSAAIDAGMVVPGASADFAGRKRDSRPDIGAWEYAP